MAAYRAGAKLRDQRRGTDADFRRRRGIVHSEILIPDGAADWLQDREQLWNQVEVAYETRRDAQLAREINIALPYELDDAARLELVRGFVVAQFVSRGMVADMAIHRPVVEKGDDARNFHAHILLTLRKADSQGLMRVKTREWNSDAMLLAWREAWADCQNRALRLHGQQVTVDHRSFAARRLLAAEQGDRQTQTVFERLPELHVGPKARKAGLAAQPKSKDSLAGPPRKYRAGKRLVRYTAIDRGSRGEWNIERLTSNARHFKRSLIKTERQLVRLRQRLKAYEGVIRLRRAEAITRRSPGAGSPGSSAGGRQSSLRWNSMRVAHARLRRQQVLILIDQLDRLFFALLGIREAQLTRRTVWQNRMRGRMQLTPAPARGRHRPL